MVSGFFTSPWLHWRMSSPVARPMRSSSKKLTSSTFSSFSHLEWVVCVWSLGRTTPSGRSGVDPPGLGRSTSSGRSPSVGWGAAYPAPGGQDDPAGLGPRARSPSGGWGRRTPLRAVRNDPPGAGTVHLLGSVAARRLGRRTPLRAVRNDPPGWDGSTSSGRSPPEVGGGVPRSGRSGLIPPRGTPPPTSSVVLSVVSGLYVPTLLRRCLVLYG